MHCTIWIKITKILTYFHQIIISSFLKKIIKLRNQGNLSLNSILWNVVLVNICKKMNVSFSGYLFIVSNSLFVSSFFSEVFTLAYE
jgi:hypothetical protein